MHIRTILKCFEKYKCSDTAFLVQSSRFVSNEQSCLKTTGLYGDVLLLDDLSLLSNSFHSPISLSLCSPISHLFFIFFLLFFWCSFSILYPVQQKSFCIHIHKDAWASQVVLVVKNPLANESLMHGIGITYIY